MLNEQRALDLINQEKEALRLEEEILSTAGEIPATASEWMAWLIDHAVEDIHYCVQQEISLSRAYRVMQFVERLELLGITPSPKKQFWQHHPELLISPSVSAQECVPNDMPCQEATGKPYAYLVALTTHRMLYQNVVVEAERPLTDDECTEKALERCTDTWEPGPIDKNPDVDEIQTLRRPAKEVPIECENDGCCRGVQDKRGGCQ